MTQTDDKELIALCVSILSDDEVTADEAYALAQWLNDHPVSAETWPGRELIGLLEEIWAGGDVTPRDLQRLARSLGGLEREWMRRSTPADTHRKVKRVDFARAQGKTPLVPRIDAVIDILSWDEPETAYRVNLRGPSCTCPEWLRWKSHLPPGHLGRCCKHIFDAYAQLPRGHAGAAWLMAFLDLGRPTNASIRWKLLSSDAEPVLVSSANKKGWADVFARDGLEYERYSYNVEEGRWSYGSEPGAASEITKEIVSLGWPNEKPALQRTDAPIRTKGSRKKLGRKTVRTLLGLGGIAAILGIGLLLDRSGHLLPQLSEVGTQKAIARPPAWTARSVRDVRIKIAGKETVVPKGAELRVIARTAKEVMVSYAGNTFTIPISETDLR